MLIKGNVVTINPQVEEKEKRSKRSSGDGTYYRDGDKYCWRVTTQEINPDTGKRRSKVIKKNSEKELNKAIKEYKNELARGRGKSASKQTIKEFINDWLYNYKINDLKDGSFDRLENTIRCQIVPRIGHLQLSTVTMDDVQKMLNNMKEDGLSFSTVKKAYDAINACFKFALLREAVYKNPVVGVIPPSSKRFEKKEIRFFSEEEIIAIKEELFRKYKTGKPIYYYPDVFILMLNTGIRVGEALGLEWNDIDWEGRTIYIQRNVISVKERDDEDVTVITGYKNIVQDTAKTFTSTRVVPLNNSAYQSLLNLKAQSKNNKIVMNNSNGNLITPSNITKTWYRLLRNAKVESCGMHTLRHTFASKLFEKGVEVKTVSEILGHASVAITYNIYIHLIPKQKQLAVELLDE